MGESELVHCHLVKTKKNNQPVQKRRKGEKMGDGEINKKKKLLTCAGCLQCLLVLASYDLLDDNSWCPMMTPVIDDDSCCLSNNASNDASNNSSDN